MADATNPATTGLTIPDEVKQKFADLLALIQASESMNDEERQYWINILPIMTPEQVKSLRDILDNEKAQLAAIDQKYQVEGSTAPAAPLQTEDERRKRREERTSKEQSHKMQEDKATEDLLKTIEGEK